MSKPNDENPDIPLGFVHMSDQAKAGAEEIAKITTVYYNQLRSDGVPQQAALQLTLEYLRLLFTAGRSK